MALSSKNSKLKGSEKKRRIEQEKKREAAIGTAVVLIVVVVVAGAAWYFVSPLLSAPGVTTSGAGSTGIGDPTLTTCINDANLVMHIHVRLSIIINGQPFAIPANIGITPTCTRPVHTHDDSGEIHIESPVAYAYTLKDFFLVWDKPFDNTQIFQFKVDSTHTLRMTLNGVANIQFENYVFHDGDQIQITYRPS